MEWPYCYSRENGRPEDQAFIEAAPVGLIKPHLVWGLSDSFNEGEPEHDENACGLFPTNKASEREHVPPLPPSPSHSPSYSPSHYPSHSPSHSPFHSPSPSPTGTASMKAWSSDRAFFREWNGINWI